MSKKKNKMSVLSEEEIKEVSAENVASLETDVDLSRSSDEDVSNDSPADSSDRYSGPLHDKPKDGSKASPVRIIVRLTLVCAIVAALLGIVNSATADRILQNNAREKENAIRSIFGSHVTITPYDMGDEAPETFLVFRSGMLYGYCCNVSPAGFGGPINMMVGVDHTGALLGVNIVSMSETPGLGSKTNTPAFLDQFKGKISAVSLGSDVDAISGATISSTAVCSGVNQVFQLKLDLLAIAEELGTILFNEALDTEPPETEVQNGSDPSQENTPPSQNEDGGRLEDTAEYVDDVGVANPPDEEYPSDDIPYEEDTVVYITETTEPDTDDTEEETTEEETTEEETTEEETTEEETTEEETTEEETTEEETTEAEPEDTVSAETEGEEESV